MPQEILCPICGASYNLADAQLGRKVRCKKCEHTFRAGGDQSRDKDDDDEDTRPRKAKSLSEQVKPRGAGRGDGSGLPVSSFVIMAIVAAVLLICGGGLGLYFLVGGKDKPTTKQQSNPPNRR